MRRSLSSGWNGTIFARACHGGGTPAGDMAVEVGDEQGQLTMAGEVVPIAQRVTNVYRREAGEWKVVHHHTDLSPAMQGVLSRLQGGG